jgi:lauroyl/myristoyl acyltransferase
MVIKIPGSLSAGSKSSSLDVAPYSYTKWWLRPQAHDRPPLYWYLLSRALALGLWTVPRRYRFSAAALLARVLTPLVRRTSWYRAKRQQRIDSASEIALYYVLEMMTNSGALFDPVLHVEGADVLNQALKKGRGVLIVGLHALLSQLIFRYLYDKGNVPTIVSTAPSAHIYGTRLVATTIQPTPVFMIRLRSILRNGGMVCAMVDGEHSTKRKLIEFDTAEGTMYISDALIRLALRCDASVLFTSVRVDARRGVLLTIAAPATSTGLTVESITEDCAAFIQAHVGQSVNPVV